MYTGGVLLGASAIPWGARVLTHTIGDAESYRWRPVDVEKLGDSDVLTIYEPVQSAVATETQSQPNTTTASAEPVYALSNVSDVVAAVAAGRLVLVMDDTSRENEGDLIMAARFVGESHTRLMIRHTSGIICAPMRQEDAERYVCQHDHPAASLQTVLFNNFCRNCRLQLPLMVTDNTDKHRTAFTVTCDAK